MTRELKTKKQVCYLVENSRNLLGQIPFASVRMERTFWTVLMWIKFKASVGVFTEIADVSTRGLDKHFRLLGQDNN